MLREGEQLGPYRIAAKLPSGGMARVFVANVERPVGHLLPGSRVAIKVVRERLAGHEQFIKMFVDEARIASQVSHPNVVRVFELGTVEGLHYLVMEHVFGVAASELLAPLARESIRLSPSLSVYLASQIAMGLHAAHQTRDRDGQLLNIVHRDVSPQNVLLAEDGRVLLLDFGIAKARDRLHVTGTNAGLKGKLRYMPPEQMLQGKLDHRADIYALAVMTWELLTMRRLYQGESDMHVISKLRSGEHQPPGAFVELPHALDSAIMRALSSNPAERQTTARQFAEELLAAVPEARSHGPQELRQLLWAVRRDLLAERFDAARVPPSPPSLAECQLTQARLTESVMSDYAAAQTIEHQASAFLSPRDYESTSVSSERPLAAAALPGEPQRSPETPAPHLGTPSGVKVKPGKATIPLRISLDNKATIPLQIPTDNKATIPLSTSTPGFAPIQLANPVAPFEDAVNTTEFSSGSGEYLLGHLRGNHQVPQEHEDNEEFITTIPLRSDEAQKQLAAIAAAYPSSDAHKATDERKKLVLIAAVMGLCFGILVTLVILAITG